MKFYEKPELDLIVFETEDIILLSNGGETNMGGNGESTQNPGSGGIVFN